MELPEIVACGVFDSRVAFKNIETSKSRSVWKFEIELALEDGGVTHIDSNAYPIRQDTVICAKPGQTRYTEFPFRCYYVHILLSEGPMRDAMNEISDSFITGKGETYRSLFVRMIRHYSSFSEDSRLLLQSRLLELIYTLRTDEARQGNTRVAARQTLIEETLNYIQDHLTEDLTLERVSKAMSFSPIYFHNTFRASVGKTLREYVEEQRIRKAIHLLLTTNDSLTKIAFECGFSSQSYFSYVFKRRMGITPRAYVRDTYKKYES